MTAVLALTLALATQLATEPPQAAEPLPAPGAPPIETFALENGVRVTLVHAETATRQAFLTLLPLGLLSDEAGHAQWSHLAEHVMLRASNPEVVGYEIDGTTLNGETTALALRLETFAPAEDWREAQQRHAAWLTTGQRAPEGLQAMLDREAFNVLGEVDGTAMAGFTHKWAVAAWNQVVRHGAGDVRVRGDVEGVQVADVLDYIRRRVSVGSAVHLVSVGPTDPAEVRAAIAEDFAGLPAAPWVDTPTALDAARLHAPQELQATWDVPVRHYMEWYPLPDRNARDRIAGDALALMLNVRLTQHGSLAGLGAQPMAQADIVTPEGRWLLLSASLADDADLERVKRELDAVLERMTPAADAKQVLNGMATQLNEWPDFAMLRAQFPDHPQIEFIETQQVLFQVYAMQNMGIDRDQLPFYGALDVQAFEDFADEVLVSERRSTLLLSPKAR